MIDKGVKMLTDNELNVTIKNLVGEERKLTKEILLHIAEVDKRRLYLKMAYPSLFEYLRKEIGYSEGSAQRRIDAARLINKLPEFSNKIESGDIHLSQISKVQKICRQIKKDSGQTVDIHLQKQIFKRLENQSSIQTDLILAQEFQMEIKKDEKLNIQKDESQRLELTFAKEEMEIIKKAQSLLSNKTGGGLKDTILEMAKKVVKTTEPKIIKELVSSDKVNSVKESLKSPSKETSTLTATVAVKSKVSLPIKKQIRHRDQVCQFKDLKTGRICGSRHYLEIDHVKPKYQGGQNNKENLRVLCKSHNTYRYQKLL